MYRKEEGLAMPDSKRGRTGYKRDKYKPNLPVVLPPCKVCGGKSSGFHFGVISCEACKVFFRRNLVSKTAFKCKNNEQCLIEQCLESNKVPCSACRWEKCASEGMSRQNIKKGRFTLATREKTSKEVKDDEEKKRKEKEKEESRLAEEELRIEALIQRTLEIEKKAQFMPPEILATLGEEHNKFMERKEAKEALFGELKPLPHDVYEGIYNSCGLDVDDRRKKLAECSMHCEIEFFAYLDFARSLPEFNTFSLDDRIILVRENYTEFALFCSLDVIDPDRELMTCVSCGVIYHAEDFEKYGDNTYKQYFNCAKVLKPLKLSDEELALIKAVLLLNAYGCYKDVPKDQIKIEKAQQKYLEALQYLLEKNRGKGAPAAKVMGKIISCVTEVKECFHMLMNNRDCYYYLYPDVECPTIVKEMFDVEDDSREKLSQFLEFLI